MEINANEMKIIDVNSHISNNKNTPTGVSLEKAVKMVGTVLMPIFNQIYRIFRETDSQRE